MSEQKPRVTASHTIEAIAEGQLCQRFVHTTPNVHVSVGFDLHDHEAALAALERAVANVRAQIEETK